jgi:hypothetical protein
MPNARAISPFFTARPLPQPGRFNFKVENKIFYWAGKTKLGLVLFLLRHTLHHIGELSSLLNESKNGVADDNWVKAL